MAVIHHYIERSSFDADEVDDEVNTCGESGPWSEITTVTVAA
jgi:hypothetical protein